ncbi:hypothetical protein J6590_029590 [Homalodisca vitripennis]|nr:hypothetical protein J6590_029590 [Homalodisca vitripennis]
MKSRLEKMNPNDVTAQNQKHLPTPHIHQQRWKIEEKINVGNSCGIAARHLKQKEQEIDGEENHLHLKDQIVCSDHPKKRRGRVRCHGADQTVTCPCCLLAKFGKNGPRLTLIPAPLQPSSGLDPSK